MTGCAIHQCHANLFCKNIDFKPDGSQIFFQINLGANLLFRVDKN